MAVFSWFRRADPLVLFLLAGFAIYLIINATGLARGDDRLIAVDEARLSAFMASQGGQTPDRTLDRLSAAERRELVDTYVREEALYREAKALELDRDDAAIRRRLVQSLRFSLQDEEALAATTKAPTDAELRTFLEAHRDRFVESPKVSFSHVFFDTRRRGRAEAEAAARQALSRGIAGDWLAQGDRYPYQRSQIDVTEAALAGELGAQATRRIFALPQGERWLGPIESELGFHLVRIDRKSTGGLPSFAEIRDGLAAGLAQQQRDQAVQRAIDSIVAGYTVRLAPPLEKSLK